MRYHQAVHDVPVLFESCERATSVDDFDATIGGMLPKHIVRSDLEIPDLPERDVVKHFINISQMNLGVDNGLYPLGSCTMKFNPKVCDEVVGLPTVARHTSSAGPVYRPRGAQAHVRAGAHALRGRWHGRRHAPAGRGRAR